MKTTGNTILITGGGSGIGRALAEEFHKAGNTVIIAGRRPSVLDEVTAANPGMASAVLDVESPEAIKAFAEKIIADYPALNVLFNNAGIMTPEDVKAGGTAVAEATVAINLLGPIRLTDALLPHLRTQADAVVINTTSGLAFVPLAITPTYSATKAALRSYTQSLRHQLKGEVEVIELAPPYVQTELMGEHQASDPNAMPLDAFIAETMANFRVVPTPADNQVGQVKFLSEAERSGEYDQVFAALNSLF